MYIYVFMKMEVGIKIVYNKNSTHIQKTLFLSQLHALC